MSKNNDKVFNGEFNKSEFSSYVKNATSIEVNDFQIRTKNIINENGELEGTLTYLEGNVKIISMKNVNKNKDEISLIIKMISNLSNTVNDLSIKVDKGFTEVNSRLDKIESIPFIKEELKKTLVY